MNDTSDFRNPGDDAVGEPNTSRLSHPIVRTGDATALTPQQLQDRSIIHRTAVASPEVEAFRDLRTKLLAMVDGTFVAMVVPVSAGCGGSFVARNLAAALAFDETRSALLFDCDLRHPSQQATMRIEAKHGGLIDYLEDDRADLETLVYPTGVPRLHLVPTGKTRETGAEYFSSYRMRLMIDTLRSRHPDRYLVLDAPPVLGSPDARILSEIADVVILVAGYGRDRPSAIAQAAASFDPAKFAGVVFNEGV